MTDNLEKDILGRTSAEPAGAAAPAASADAGTACDPAAGPGRTIVLYYSKYGATKQYAEWIAGELGADLVDVRARKPKLRDIRDYDTIIYGGGIYSGGIKGVELITKNWSKGLSAKRVIVFAVGMAVDVEANREQCREINFEKRLIYWMDGEEYGLEDAVGEKTDISSESQTAESRPPKEAPGFRELLKQTMMPVKCFFLPGRYDPAAIRGLDKGIMAFTRKLIGDGASGATAGSAEMIRRMENGCDLIDRNAIQEILDAARGE